MRFGRVPRDSLASFVRSGARERPTCRLAAVLLLGAFLPSAPAADAQLPAVTGYYLHAAAALEATPLSESGAFDVQRVRLMMRPGLGPFVVDLAYEHTLTLRTTSDAGMGRGFEGGAQGAAPWIGLQGTIHEGDRVTWAHGFDRLVVQWRPSERVRVTAGRQAVSWATTLYFTPADPFVPFDPADPFREYRAGVDALRTVVFLGPFSELDAVVRMAPDLGQGETVTALLRGQHMVRGWDVAGWVGVVHEEEAAALSLVGSAGAWGIRTEGGVRRSEGETVFRGALGLDRRFDLLDRDLRALIEVQHDGFGAGSADELLPVLASLPRLRGELPVLGRDALVVHAAWQLRPLTEVALLSLVNLRDGSALLSPGLVHSVSNEATLRLGVYAGAGPGIRQGPTGPTLRSEHGFTPLAGYAAFSLFF